MILILLHYLVWFSKPIVQFVQFRFRPTELLNSITSTLGWKKKNPWLTVIDQQCCDKLRKRWAQSIEINKQNSIEQKTHKFITYLTMRSMDINRYTLFLVSTFLSLSLSFAHFFQFVFVCGLIFFFHDCVSFCHIFQQFFFSVS